jgi:hypothetical protein
MSGFFDSPVIQEEMQEMFKLFTEINQMGILMTPTQKKLQLEKMLRLIEMQQVQYVRITLSDDPNAKEMLTKMKEAAKILGMDPEDISSSMYDKLKQQVTDMIHALGPL